MRLFISRQGKEPPPVRAGSPDRAVPQGQLRQAHRARLQRRDPRGEAAGAGDGGQVALHLVRGLRRQLRRGQVPQDRGRVVETPAISIAGQQPKDSTYHVAI